MIKLIRFVGTQIPRNGSFMSCTKIISYRAISAGGQNFIRPPIINRYRLSDKIPENYELIYRSRTTKYVKWFYPLSILSFVMMSGSCIYYNYFAGYVSFPVRTKGINPIIYRNSREINITYFCYLCMNIVTLFLLRRFVVRIWRNAAKDEYKLVMVGSLPSFTRRLTVKSGEITRKHLDPQNSLQDIIHWYKNKTFYYITMTDFKTSAEYYRMMNQDMQNDD